MVDGVPELMDDCWFEFVRSLGDAKDGVKVGRRVGSKRSSSWHGRGSTAGHFGGPELHAYAGQDYTESSEHIFGPPGNTTLLACVRSIFLLFVT